MKRSWMRRRWYPLPQDGRKPTGGSAALSWASKRSQRRPLLLEMPGSCSQASTCARKVLHKDYPSALLLRDGSPRKCSCSKCIGDKEINRMLSEAVGALTREQLAEGILRLLRNLESRVRTRLLCQGAYLACKTGSSPLPRRAVIHNHHHDISKPRQTTTCTQLSIALWLHVLPSSEEMNKYSTG